MAGNRGEVSKLPKFMWMTADIVANEAYEAVEAGRPVWINGRVNRFIALLARWLPHRLVYALMATNQRNARPRRA